MKVEDYEKDDDWAKHVPKRNLVCPKQNCEIKLGYPSCLRKHLTRVHFSKLSGKKAGKTKVKKNGIVDVDQFDSMQNKIRKSENLLECNGCKGVWHRCCTTHIGIRDAFWSDSCKKADLHQFSVF
ncbi:unnamed protein product [Caenorhabditis nigoni]